MVKIYKHLFRLVVCRWGTLSLLESNSCSDLVNSLINVSVWYHHKMFVRSSRSLKKIACSIYDGCREFTFLDTHWNKCVGTSWYCRCKSSNCIFKLKLIYKNFRQIGIGICQHYLHIYTCSELVLAV